MNLSIDLLKSKNNMSMTLLEGNDFELERILHKSGYYKKYYKFIIGILFFISFNMGIIGYLTPFFIPEVKLDCIKLGDETKKIINCYKFIDKYKTMEELKKHYEVTSNIDFESLTSIYDLYYENKGIYNLIKNIILAAASLTCFLFSFIADSFGKKLTMILSVILVIIGSILLFFKIGLWFDIFMYILMYAGCDYFFSISFVYISEIAKNKDKLTFLGYSYACWAFGGLFINIITIKHFSYIWINLILLILTGIAFFISLFLIESPIYLVITKKKNQLVNLFSNICGKSSLNKEEVIKNVENFYDNYQSNLDKNDENMINVNDELENLVNNSPHSSFVIAFTNFEIFKRLFINVIFFGIVYIIYGITVVCIEDIGSDNINLNGAVLAVLEGAGYLVNIPISNKIKRKKFLILNSLLIVLIGFILFGIHYIDSTAIEYIETILSGFIKFQISGIITVEFIYISELFPTKVRIICCGLILFFCRGLTFFSNSINLLSKSLEIHTLTIPSIALLFTIPLFKFIPETKIN